MSKMGLAAALALMLGACGGFRSAAAQSPPMWGSLTPGTHDVGLRRLWRIDESRIWSRSEALDSLRGEVGRPIRVDVWYPADCAERPRMSLRDYVEMESPGPSFDDLVFLTHRWDAYSYRGLADDSLSYERLMSTPTAACAGGQPDGRHPVVLYSAGWFNRSPDNTVLLEFLASHGYVVVTIPQLNPGLWTFEFASDARSVENQVRDLEVALGHVIREPYADRRRVAAMGYSTGGDVALLLQGRNALIDAVVGLDASFTLGADNDVAGAAGFEAAAHTVPILALRRPRDGSGANQLLDALFAAPRIVVEVPAAEHGTFSDDPGQRAVLGQESSSSLELHAAVARTVHHFLDEALKASTPDFANVERRAVEFGLRTRYRPREPVERPSDGTAEE